MYDISLRAERVTLQLEVGQIVYIPGAADLRSEVHDHVLSYGKNDKEQRILEYIEKTGSISTQKVTELCGYKTKAGARKLLDKMIENGKIQRSGSGPATKYVRVKMQS